MPITLNADEIKDIIRNLINGNDHRGVVQEKIDEQFFEYVIDFFKKVFDAKMRKREITEDWYKAEFLDPKLRKEDLIINSGLNAKTIENMYGDQKKATVVIAVDEHYEEVYKVIAKLIEKAEGLEVQLTIKIGVMAVELSLSETLIVVSALAVKRAAIVGGAWSSVGKQVEKPLMTTLCKLFSVPHSSYRAASGKNSDNREVDYYLINRHNKEFECEVKLMGKGNPESADGAHAHGSDVFIAATISQTGKTQFDTVGIHWIELRIDNGYRKFHSILQQLDIPCSDFQGDVNQRLDEIFETSFL